VRNSNLFLLEVMNLLLGTDELNSYPVSSLLIGLSVVFGVLQSVGVTSSDPC
jgi:hypothetical protein